MTESIGPDQELADDALQDLVVSIIALAVAKATVLDLDEDRIAVAFANALGLVIGEGTVHRSDEAAEEALGTLTGIARTVMVHRKRQLEGKLTTQ